MRPLLLALALTTAVAAQPEWRALPAGPSLSVDVLTAVGGENSVPVTDASGTLLGTSDVRSSVLLVAGRVPVGARWAVRAEVPLAFSSYRFSGDLADPVGDAADASVGNPYLGVEARVGLGLVLGAGLRVALFNDVADADGFGWQGGLDADIERFEAYLPDVVAVSGSAELARPLGPSARLRLRLAPAVVVDVYDGENNSGRSGTAVLLGYALQGEVDVRAVTLRGGVVGRPHLSDDRFDGFETWATALAGATVAVGGVRPGLSVRVPLDVHEIYRDPAATVGLTLDVPLR